MMETISNWIKRHKKKIIISAGLVGGGYICYRTFKAYYSTVQEKELHAALLQQQAELHVETQLQLHFQNVQKICDTTTLPIILPHLKNEVLSYLQVSQLAEKLMQGTLTTQEKIDLWQELKILGFTQAFSTIWALILLVLFIRVQLNILARHVYMEASRDMTAIETAGQIKGLPRSTQEKYLAFAGFLTYRGLELLIADTKKAVEHVLANKSLREPCTFQDLREIFHIVGNSFENSKPRWIEYLLPDSNTLPADLLSTPLAADLLGYEEQIGSLNNEENIESLVDETRVILDSMEFRDVMVSSFQAVLDSVVDELAGLYQDRKTTTIPFAKLVAPVSDLGPLLLVHPAENKFIQLLTNLPQVQAFCATVYSTGT